MAPAPMLDGAARLSSYWMIEAVVKSTEPPKKVADTTEEATALKNSGIDPNAKQIEPPANSPAIHQHDGDGRRARRPVEASSPPRPRRLRWARERHSTRRPSGRRKCALVINGPACLVSTTAQPSGRCGKPHLARSGRSSGAVAKPLPWSGRPIMQGF